MGNEECEVKNEELTRKWLKRRMEVLLESGEDWVPSAEGGRAYGSEVLGASRKC